MNTNDRVAVERRFFRRAGPPAWPVDVRSIGWETRLDSTLVERPRGAGFFIIMWTVHGTGKLKTPRGIHGLKPGTLFLVPPETGHAYWAPGKTPFWEVQWLTLDGRFAVPWMEQLGLNRILVRPLAGFPGTSTVRILDALRRPGVSGGLDRLEACLRLLHEISAQLSGKALKYGDRFDALMQWAGNRAYSQLSVQAMAAEAGLSRTHFSRLFRAETGMTPVDFLMEVRLSKAEELLLGSRKPVKQIAGECGFFDAAHFSRQFRKATGLTPGRYRRTALT